MRTLESYSDALGTAPKTLRSLIEKDSRIVAFTIEQRKVFIYTKTADWDNGNGSGTFSGDTVREAIKLYRETVTKNTEGRI